MMLKMGCLGRWTSIQVLFFFILQYLSRAIVLTSFDDASRSFEEKQKVVGDQPLGHRAFTWVSKWLR